jgi:hypothetical protein
MLKIDSQSEKRDTKTCVCEAPVAKKWTPDGADAARRNRLIEVIHQRPTDAHLGPLELDFPVTLLPFFRQQKEYSTFLRV